MFLVLLKFSDGKAKAGHYMQGHNEWLRSGFDDGVFLLAGSVQPNMGGAIQDRSAAAFSGRLKIAGAFSITISVAPVVGVSFRTAHGIKML